jgi:hypothetical protein
MKLTLLSSALAAVLVLACTPVQAQTPAPVATSTPGMAASTTPAMSMKPVPYKGTITAMTATAVTVQGAKAVMTLAITPDTKYRGGKAVTDFAVGDKVTGSYTKDASGAMTAYSLHKKKAK